MKSKVVLPTIMILVLVLVLTVSPVGIGTSIEKLEDRRILETKMETYAFNIDTIESSLEQSQKAFSESRSFEVDFGDVTRIYGVLSNISGIEVRDVEKIDPFSGFIACGLLNEGDSYLAVKFNLLVTDAATALSVLEKMQLPVYSVTWDSPNTMSVIILTGGVVQ